LGQGKEKNHYIQWKGKKRGGKEREVCKSAKGRCRGDHIVILKKRKTFFLQGGGGKEEKRPKGGSNENVDWPSTEKRFFRPI